MVNYDFGKIKASIEAKEKEVQQLEAELEKPKKVSEDRRQHQSKDVKELEGKINALKKSTKEQEN